MRPRRCERNLRPGLRHRFGRSRKYRRLPLLEPRHGPFKARTPARPDGALRRGGRLDLPVASSHETRCYSTAYKCHSPGTPLSEWTPLSANAMPEPATRTVTVRETITSPALATAPTRAPMFT